MLASGLAITPQSGTQYFRTAFVSDLILVTRGATDAGPTRLSVASFCPDYPRDPIYSVPAQRFAQLPEQRWFIASLFVTQLTSQASYSRGVPYSFGPPAVLVGLLSSYWSIVNPGFLILVLAMYREAVEAADTGEGIEGILRAQLDELRTKDSGARRGVVGEMLAALEEHHMPVSLGSVVPHANAYRFSPSLDAAHAWSGRVADALGAAAA